MIKSSRSISKSSLNEDWLIRILSSFLLVEQPKKSHTLDRHIFPVIRDIVTTKIGFFVRQGLEVFPISVYCIQRSRVAAATWPMERT